MKENGRLRQLFTYDCWANKKIADILINHRHKILHESRRLFAHILASQQSWYQRIKGHSSTTLDLWPEESTPKNDMEQLHRLHQQWTELVKEKANELDSEILYKNSSGNEFQTPLGSILHHVIIHSQHHRAQIASQLRKQGIKPPGTDYIFYLRQLNA